MRIIPFVLALAVATACGGDKNQPQPNPAAEQPPATSGGEDMTGARGPVAPPPDGGAYQFEACVKDCVRRNQTQTIPVEQIEANCQGECAGEKK